MKLKKQHTIMIVDDEETIIKSLKRLLARAGHQCLSALSGAEALQYLMVADDPISLIISDQRMPGMSGGLMLMKSRQIRPHMIRMLLTGYTDIEAAIDAISCFQLLGDCICISTAGVRSNPPWLQPLLARGYAVHCGFDNDEPGEITARQMIDHHPSIQRLRPPAHDWNEAIISGN